MINKGVPLIYIFVCVKGGGREEARSFSFFSAHVQSKFLPSQRRYYYDYFTVEVPEVNFTVCLCFAVAPFCVATRSEDIE